MKKLRKAQPRSKTPPVSFRDEDIGERVVLLVDESFATKSATWISRGRQPIFLKLGPGLEVRMRSARVNKRRYSRLQISVARTL